MTFFLTWVLSTPKADTKAKVSNGVQYNSEVLVYFYFLGESSGKALLSPLIRRISST